MNDAVSLDILKKSKWYSAFKYLKHIEHTRKHN